MEEYRRKVTKSMKNNKYMKNLAVYKNCLLQDFESFPRTDVDLAEDDITLALDEYI